MTGKKGVGKVPQIREYSRNRKLCLPDIFASIDINIWSKNGVYGLSKIVDETIK